MQSQWWAVLAAAIFVLVLRRFFFPSRFTLDDEGATAEYPLATRRILWADVRGHGLSRSGGTLSTRSRPSVFGPNRSLALIYRREDAERIVPLIRSRLASRLAERGSGSAADASERLEGSSAWG